MSSLNLKKRPLIICLSVVLVLGILLAVCAVYVSDYYAATPAASTLFADTDETEFEEQMIEGGIAFLPKSPHTGLIFYPGGKVEYTAYAPLMRALASKGILCVLLEMPLNLAVLDVNAAKGIQEQYTEVDDWYMGGHSLGGSMAASYLAKNADAFKGLLLFASYSTADLSGSGLSVLSLYGSEDGVLNREKYEENKENLPDDFAEHVIEGGNHAYFGMYGEQEGDGAATLTPEEQISAAAALVLDFVLR